MALTERKEAQVTVLPDGQLQVRETTIIERDGVEVTRAHHRKVVEVGADVSAEEPLVQEIAQAVHTPARVQAREQARQVAQGRLP